MGTGAAGTATAAGGTVLTGSGLANFSTGSVVGAAIIFFAAILITLAGDLPPLLSLFWDESGEISLLTCDGGATSFGLFSADLAG
jgi:putative exporter of polyketide antibiotics